MKNTLLLLLMSIGSFAFSQNTPPSGTTYFIDFTNSTSSFQVPPGHTWYIYNVYSDYVVGGTVKYDDYSKKNVLEDSEGIRIFIKTLNGKTKTDYVKNIYGPQLYRSTNASTVIPFPIIFTENTSFSLITLKGDLGSLQPHSGTSYISFIEVPISP